MNSARPVLVLTGLFIAALIAASSSNALAEEHRPRVFITDSESWEVVGSAAGSGGSFASRTQGGARPQTSASHAAVSTSVAAPAASQSFQPTPMKTDPVQGAAFVAPAAVKTNPVIPVQTPAQTMPAPVPEKTTAAASSLSTGTVSVTSDPDGAEIFVDSVGYGHAPSILKLATGKHSIQLVRQGFKDWTSDLNVRENSIVNVTARLEK
jgi:hypothetical protein